MNKPLKTTRIALATLGVLALASGCTQDIASTAQPAESVALPGGVAGDAEQPVATLGDLNPPASAAELGAPFDPCTVVGWGDFPEQARGAAEPTSEPKEPGAPYEIACGWEGPNYTLVAWGTEPDFAFDESERPNRQPVEIDGTPAVQYPGMTENQVPRCESRMRLPNGVAGVVTVAYSHPAPCEVNTALLRVIASKT